MFLYIEILAYLLNKTYRQTNPNPFKSAFFQTISMFKAVRQAFIDAFDPDLHESFFENMMTRIEMSQAIAKQQREERMKEWKRNRKI